MKSIHLSVLLSIAWAVIVLSASIPGAYAHLEATPSATPSAPQVILPSKTIQLTGFVDSVAWSPDGARLASIDYGVLRMWDTQTWQPMFVAWADSIPVAWHPNGKQIATTKGGEVERLLIWDIATGTLVKQFKRPEEGNAVAWISRAAWSPDGKMVATNASDGGILLWNVETGVIRSLERSQYTGVVGVSWSPDSKKVAGGYAIWDVAKGRKVLDIKGGNWPSWNHTGDRIANADVEPTQVQVRNANTGRIIWRLKGHTGNVLTVAWSPDDRLLASGANDSTIIIWDTRTGRAVAILKGHTRSLNSVSWEPNGRRIASGSLDGTIRIWDVSGLR